MREKLNENPIAQVGLVVVLVAVVGFMVLKGSGGGEGGEETAATTEATVAVAGTEATGTATGASAGEAVEGAVSEALEAAATEPAALPTAVPAPPLPAPISSAYDAGKTVALLVVHDGGIDDRIATHAAQAARSVPGVDLTVVPARRIARYAAVTLGVDVQQVPALVVMRPRRLSGGIPQASVSYGLQTPQTVIQAVRDASYEGRETTYHPE